MDEEPNAAENGFIDRVLEIVEYVAFAIEVLAVVVIAIGVVYAFSVYFVGRTNSSSGQRIIKEFRERLGHTLLTGLEILVAADVIRTVALEPSLENVAILGLLVVIRTFLSWSLEVEIEGRWPWKASVGATADRTSTALVSPESD